MPVSAFHFCSTGGSSVGFIQSIPSSGSVGRVSWITYPKYAVPLTPSDLHW